METIRLLLKKPCLQNLHGQMIVPEEQKKDMLIFSGKEFNEAEKAQSRNILVQFNQENIIDLLFEDSAHILDTFMTNNHPQSQYNHCLLT